MKIRLERVGNRIHLTSPWREDIPVRAKTVPGYGWAKSAKAWTWPLDYEICRMLRSEFGDELEIGPELWAWAAEWKRRCDKLHEILKMDYPPSSPLLDKSARTINSPENTNPSYARTRKTQSIARKAIAGNLLGEEGGEGGSKLFSAISNRPYQWTGVEFLSAAKQAILADQPGVGKTLESLAALLHCGVSGKVLIAAPSTSCLATWEPEIRRWLDDGSYTITQLSGLTSGRRWNLIKTFSEMQEKPGVINFMIANPEMIRYLDKKAEDGSEARIVKIQYPHLFEIEFAAIIADETHKFLINVSGKSASQTGTGFSKLKVKEGGLKFALSGTPLKGKAYNIWGTLNWLRPDIYSTRWGWVERYFELNDNGYSNDIIGLRSSKTKAFHRELGSFMIRRTKDELRKMNPEWMPPEKQYHDVWVEMTPKQAKIYKSMESTAEANIDGKTLNAIGVLAEFTRLKQIAGAYGRVEKVKRRDPKTKELEEVDTLFPELPSAKFDWLVEFLEERGISKDLSHESDEIRKVVVASQFTRSINMWSQELNKRGIKTFVLTGETNQNHRAQYQQLFQDPSQTEVRVFMINTTAGGVSITLDAADDIVLMDETWVPDEQEQVEDRVHRASDVTHQVDVWYVRCLDTVEEHIAKVAGQKSYTNHIALDSQRGLEFARSRGWEPPKKEDE